MYKLLLCLLFCFSVSALESPQQTVSKVRIKSSLLGKDRFLQQYLLEPGDYFNKEIHDRSLVLIKEKLVADGYLAASVEDEFTVDQLRGTVAISLLLTPEKRYTIADVQIELPHDSPDDSPYHARLRAELLDLFQSALVGEYAEKELLNEQGKKVRSFLVRKGYIKPEIHLSKRLDAQKGHLHLSYTITLDERQEVLFSGNTFFTDNELLDDIYSLKEQGILLPPALLAQDIEELYKKKGFFSVQVTWQEQVDRITFSIHEGSRHSIGSVTIKELFTDSDALEVIQKLEKSLMGLSAYDEDEVNQLLRQASNDLSQLGFWQMALEKNISTSSDSSVALTVHIRQSGDGDRIERTMISGIVIPGYEELLSKGPFNEWLNLSTPRPLRPADVDEQRRWLLRSLRQQGNLLATVTHEIQMIEGVRHLVWTIDLKGGPVRFGSISIVGLHKLKPFIVSRELCFYEGAVWDPRLLEESVRALKRLRMFESIAIHPQEIRKEVGPDGSVQNVRSVIIKCCEDDPFELLTRFGLQFVSKSFTNLSWTTWKLGGSFIWKNPSGYADRLILDVDWTRYTLNVAGSYELPWMGPIPVRTQFKVYRDRFDQPLISSNNVRLYTEAHDGASITFTHLHPLWSTCVQSGFEFNKLSGISQSVAQVIQFEPMLVDKRTPYFYIEPSVTFEHFDDKTDPTKGYFTTMSLKAMVPTDVPEGWFVKVVLEQSLFYPLYGSLIGALRWRFGHIFNACFSTILPTERFYLGGANSLRGYETNMAPPLNDLSLDDERCLWVPVGGKTMVNINSELRFPLYKRLSGVLFTDMGILTQDRITDIAANTQDRKADIEANKWLGASGFGLRFASPFGPIRFDIGWKWRKRDPKDRSYAFFLTFGHAF